MDIQRVACAFISCIVSITAKNYMQVVAVPSRKYGEEVGAFIIPKPGFDLAPEDVRDHCRGRIAWHKVPRYIAIVEAFPLTASGKVQKYKLREMAAEMFPEAMQ